MSNRFFLAVVLMATSVIFGDEIARNQSSYSDQQRSKEELLFIFHAQDGHLQ